jgi:phosphoketolase
LAQGAVVLQETVGTKTLVLAVIGDMTLIPAYEAASQLTSQGYGVKIVSVINPRRLYRPTDVQWQDCSQGDGEFLSDADFKALFGGDALIGLTGGPGAMLEPVMLRSNAPRDLLTWKRGETTASAGELMAYNGLTPQAIGDRGLQLLA